MLCKFADKQQPKPLELVSINVALGDNKPPAVYVEALRLLARMVHFGDLKAMRWLNARGASSKSNRPVVFDDEAWRMAMDAFDELCAAAAARRQWILGANFGELKLSETQACTPTRR